MREITSELKRRRYSCGNSLRQPLPETFEISKEEGATAAVINLGDPDGAAYGKAELIICQLGTLLAGPVLEKSFASSLSFRKNS